MILLDTDHATALKYTDNARTRRLLARMASLPAGEVVALSIVTVEEQMRGWLAAIAKERQARRQVFGYRELQQLFEYFLWFQIIAFDDACAARFDTLRSARIRIGTMDLKIAAAALVHDATLLSANIRDFEQVPGLTVENWLD